MSSEANKAEANKAVVRQWLAARNSHDVEAAVALWADDQQAMLRSAFNHFSQGFPDIQVTIQEMIGEGDKVAVWFIVQGTHLGPWHGIPATGKAIRWEVSDLYTIREQKIAAIVRRADNLSRLLQQPNE